MSDHLSDISLYTKNLTVLYVEDDEMLSEIMQNYIRRLFDHIETAVNGKEGLELFKTHPFDLVISDIRMPVMDGIEMARQIKAIDPEQKIVITSASDESDNLMRLIEIGVDKFVLKPIVREKLYEAIRSVCKAIYESRMAAHYHASLEEINRYNQIEQTKAHTKQKNMVVNDLLDDSRFNILSLYKASDILSGDFYSLYIRQNGSLLIYLLDGMGHGILPSLTSFAVASAVKRFLYENISFADFANLFLKTLQTVLDSEEQLSCVFIEIDENQKQLQYFSAGMYPVLLRDGKQLHELRANNMPLMKFDDAIQLDHVSIESLDALMVYSDGLIEDERHKGGMQGVRDLFGDKMALEAALEAIQESDSQDDTTVIYLERKNPAA